MPGVSFLLDKCLIMPRGVASAHCLHPDALLHLIQMLNLAVFNFDLFTFWCHFSGCFTSFIINAFQARKNV